jgi:putative ABC transport system permease protein
MAALGIAGLVVFTVTQRTREIGLRIALGATPSRVVRTVTQRSLIWCAAGMVTGAAASFAIARTLAGSYYEFSDIDPLAIAAACVVLAMVAFTASYLPARRAARVDPAVTLRTE